MPPTLTHSSRWIWIPTLLAVATLSAASPASEKFVGSWKLISFERTSRAGEVSYPLGRDAVGRITYDAAGRMSVQIMQPNRPKEGALQMFAAHGGYLAYFGSYTVDESRGVVIHNVEASLFPDYIGTAQERHYTFTGNRLMLTADAPQSGHSKLIWERIP